uniref:BBSome-interacting protein 1 n=1 Tax=Pavo cristatus TaxID=9049 RepID=A0A8C9L860_PAVCR
VLRAPPLRPWLSAGMGHAASPAAMPEGKGAFREVLPKQGQLSVEDTAGMVLCKPKVLPLKSVSLEKLEQLQRAAMEKQRQSDVDANVE